MQLDLSKMQRRRQYYEDDDTITTVGEPATMYQDEQLQHAVFIKVPRRNSSSSSNNNNVRKGKGDFTSISQQYEFIEERLDRNWYERKVVRNPRNVSTADTPVGKLCGISDIRIYFRNYENDEQHKQQSRSKKRTRQAGPALRPINKMATLLTFDPDTGLYGQLIRGNAYVVIGGSGRDRKRRNGRQEDFLDAEDQVRVLRDVMSIVFRHKKLYHQFGADFSEDGRNRLLRACKEYKNSSKSRNNHKGNHSNLQQQRHEVRQNDIPMHSGTMACQGLFMF